MKKKIMKKIKKVFSTIKSKRYIIYHGRWQLSTIVMSAPITLFSYYFSPVIALALSQVIGACIFWKVDEWIFEDS